MPRIQLDLRDAYAFSCRMVVRTTDLNYGGHLGNDRLLSLLHEARVAFLASHGWSELDCAGAGLIMADAVVVYRGEAFAGDELRFDVVAAEPSRGGFRLAYRVVRPADGQEIARAETGLVSFDYAKRRIAPLPAAVRAICEGGD